MAANTRKDIAVLRDLARQYLEIASDPIQEARRRLWRDHNSLRPTAVMPVLVSFGMWNHWCRELFSDQAMVCQDPFYRGYERDLRLSLFQHSVGDDSVMEPWLTVTATQLRGPDSIWGVPMNHSENAESGAWTITPPIVEWADMAKLSPPPHVIDEEATAANVARLGEAVGDILPINVNRGPVCVSFSSDLSFHAGQLRGIEQLMIDMCESPKELHALMAFMRDGVLANQQAAEDAGDLGAANQAGQSPYAHETVPPAPNSYGHRRRKLWAFMASQEFEGVSPAMHDEFLIQYQLPILKQWALVQYGCCENLTHKIDILRQIPNLRVIAVTPRADVRRCAEQIGRDYVLSWRPNPADMVCCQFDEQLIRRTIRSGLQACRGCHVHVRLKDIETVQDDPHRLARWVQIVREVAEEVAP
jgi:hypothetical protein